MTLFSNEIHKHVWQEVHCHSCFQPDEMARRLHGENRVCPIWAKAMESGRKPVAWKRNTRAKLMAESYTCTERITRPALAKPLSQKTHCTDVPMFNVEPHEVGYIPVKGWPERFTMKKGDDHQ